MTAWKNADMNLILGKRPILLCKNGKKGFHHIFLAKLELFSEEEIQKYFFVQVIICLQFSENASNSKQEILTIIPLLTTALTGCPWRAL